MTPSGEILGATRPSLLVGCGDVFFRHRNAIFPVACIVLFAAFPPAPPLGDAGLDRWMDLLGLAVALVGQTLRAAVIGYAYIKRGGKHGRVYAARLVTEGFFAHSRNPLYLGNLLILLGLFLIHNNAWVYALGLTFFAFAYRSIVAAEEVYLRQKFPEYDDYCRRVPRWLPRLHGLRRSLEGFRFDWRRLVTKEYGSAFAWTATAVLLLAYETVTFSDYRREGPRLIVLAVVLAALAAGWAAARYVKKGAVLTYS